VVIKKTEKKIKFKKLKKKQPSSEKKPIKILKKPTGSVRFYKLETKKTEPNRKNQAKPGKTKPNKKKPNQTGLNRFLS